SPERVAAALVSDRFFDVLGARPLIGRVLQEGDDRPGAPKTAVISHTLWTRRYHGDPAIVGRPIALDAESHTIVGVRPAGLWFSPAGRRRLARPDDEPAAAPRTVLHAGHRAAEAGRPHRGAPREPRDDLGRVEARLSWPGRLDAARDAAAGGDRRRRPRDSLR